MPAMAAVVSWRAAVTGRPQPRLLAAPRISSATLSAAAARTHSAASSSEAGLRSSMSEPRELGMRQRAAAHMHATQFGAAMQGRKHLAGVEQQLWIEGAFQALLLLEVDLGEHLGHQVSLLNADTVLAGQDA